MTVFGVIAIIRGMLAMLMPGLTGLSVVTLVGVLVVGGGIVSLWIGLLRWGQFPLAGA